MNKSSGKVCIGTVNAVGKVVFVRISVCLCARVWINRIHHCTFGIYYNKIHTHIVTQRYVKIDVLTRKDTKSSSAAFKYTRNNVLAYFQQKLKVKVLPSCRLAKGVWHSYKSRLSAYKALAMSYQRDTRNIQINVAEYISYSGFSEIRRWVTVDLVL